MRPDDDAPPPSLRSEATEARDWGAPGTKLTSSDQLPNGGRADEDMLQTCRERGVAARNAAFEGESFANRPLDGLRADSVSLRDVDMRGVRLERADWIHCDLSDVRLDRARASDATFRMCRFEGVRWVDADLSRAKLENCEAVGAVLDGATLDGASLADTDLTRASLRRASLRGVDASGATFRGADLREAVLAGASLVDTDLRGADLRGATMDDVDLEGADLRGALFEEGDEAPSAPPRLRSGGAAETPSPDVYFPELANAVAPVVLDVLQRGKGRGLLDEGSFRRMVKDLEKYGIDADDPTAALRGPLGQVLEQVSATGVAPLLAALRQGGDTPPPEVAELIDNLMKDAELGDDATTEDLVAHLLTQLWSSLPPPMTD